MKVENKNQPAFPISEEETDRIEEGVEIYCGLTKREYYAGLAMTAWIKGFPDEDESRLAIWSVNSADALLIALRQ